MKSVDEKYFGVQEFMMTKRVALESENIHFYSSSPSLMQPHVIVK
jgi:hypothetical protein